MRRGPAARRLVPGGGLQLTPGWDSYASLVAWWDSPFATVTPGTNADTITSCANRGSIGGAFAGATGPIRERSQGAAHFSGAQRLMCASASDWAFLSTGVGQYSAHGVFRYDATGANCVIAATFNLSTSQIGWGLFLNPSGVLTLRAGNGSGSAYALNQNILSVAVATEHVWSVVGDGADVEVFLSGSSVFAGTLSSPSASGPTHTLTIGNSNGGSLPLGGYFPEMLIFAGSNLPPRVAVEAYLATRWDLGALSPTPPSP